jgi:MscS family membrane protein
MFPFILETFKYMLSPESQLRGDSLDLNTILDMSFYNNTIEQYLIFLAILFSSYILARVAYFILKKIFRAFTRRTKTVLDDIILKALRRPVVFFLFITGAYWGAKILTLSPGVHSVLKNTYLVLVVLDIAYGLIRLVNKVSTDYLMVRAAKTKTRMDDQMIPLFRKSAIFAIALFSFLLILSLYGVNITSLLAGLGIGGLAVALAAQDTISNIFGAITVYADKPFVIGDRVKIKGHEGYVEEIGLRSIKLKTKDRTFVTIPNSVILKEPTENLYQFVLRRVKLKLTLDNDTPNKKIERLIKLIPKELNKITDLDKSYTQMHFIDFGSYGLDFEVRYLVKRKSNRSIREVSHQANMVIKKALEQEKIEMPYPTQEIYLRK